MTTGDQTLELSMLGVAVEFQEQETHNAALVKVMEGLHQRLADAGFEGDGQIEASADVLGPVGVYALWSLHSWRLLDSQARIQIDLSIEAHTRKSRCGEITVELEMVDDPSAGNGPGILQGLRFKESFSLQPSTSLEDAASWKAWVELGLGQLHPNTLEDLFGRALSHLEKAVTP